MKQTNRSSDPAIWPDDAHAVLKEFDRAWCDGRGYSAHRRNTHDRHWIKAFDRAMPGRVPPWEKLNYLMAVWVNGPKPWLTEMTFGTGRDRFRAYRVKWENWNSP